MDEETQAFIDAFKRPDGVMDWYKVLDVPRSATQEQIRDSFAILSATFGPRAEGRSKEDTVRHVLLKQAFAELDDPARRKKYEAFLRHEQDHARLLVAIDSERQKQRIAGTNAKSASGIVEIISRKVDSRLKRIALVAFPFLVAVALFRLSQDLDHYSWEPSLSFVLFSMASALCVLIAFTKFGNWLSGHQ
ncbi:MAG: DnaJ domain-containing protein [Gammaproteobacteria bacterium]|nr:DnaJ domain-containing protein [Gammaproteobacteria bacterium]MBU1977971.1 DnaJ domain-containing protein [Gammaproteobacteria bacterium]